MLYGKVDYLGAEKAFRFSNKVALENLITERAELREVFERDLWDKE